MDSLRHSGIVIDLDDDLEDVPLKWFAEIHGVTRGRAFPEVLVTSDSNGQRSPSAIQGTEEEQGGQLRTTSLRSLQWEAVTQLHKVGNRQGPQELTAGSNLLLLGHKQRQES